MKAKKTSYLPRILTAVLVLTFAVQAVPAFAQVSAPGVEPASPTSLQGAWQNSGVHLNWRDNSNNESSFWVMRSTDSTGNNWQLIDKAPANSTSMTDTSANRNTSYYYRVRAVTVTGGSKAWSNMIFVKASPQQPSQSGQSPFWIPNDPAARENTTAVPGRKVVDLTWKENSYSESGYSIERRNLAGGSWSVIATTGKNSESYRDQSVQTGITYQYRLRAFGYKNGQLLYSFYSTTASVHVQ
jgi:fibronectin type 3 domain-containing protein